MHSRSDTSEKFAQLAIINNHSVLFLAMLYVTLEFHFPFFFRWFSLGTPVSSTNKTDCHDITEILLKVALNTITLILAPPHFPF
jgi:hypothetical protein